MSWDLTVPCCGGSATVVGDYLRGIEMSRATDRDTDCTDWDSHYTECAFSEARARDATRSACNRTLGGTIL
jgi:hypothetical protein